MKGEVHILPSHCIRVHLARVAEINENRERRGFQIAVSVVTDNEGCSVAVAEGRDRRRPTRPREIAAMIPVEKERPSRKWVIDEAAPNPVRVEDRTVFRLLEGMNAICVPP